MRGDGNPTNKPSYPVNAICCKGVRQRKSGSPPNTLQREVNTMSANEMEMKIAKLQEWEQLLEEAKAEVETLKDEIKAEMLNRKTEEMSAGRYIVRWTSVLSNRFDTTTFKREHAEMYKQYTKQTASRRFSVA